jgi:thiamine-phosphate pyrophosphorylase
MFDYKYMVAVTNRHVFDNEADPEAAFLKQIRKVAGLCPKFIVLREKDLTEEEYTALAGRILTDAPEYLRQHLVLHNYPGAALKLKISGIHLPLGALKGIHDTDPCLLRRFDTIGTSVHSVDDALEAVRCGAGYLFAGNVWETTCKPGLGGRGLEFLKDVAQSVSIPVYGIGGVSEERMPEILAAGAAGGCMMSGFMNL